MRITFMIFSSILMIALLLSGCITVHRYEKERVDQDLSFGNRGTLAGEVEPLQKEEKAKTREIINIEVELPTLSDFKRGRKTEDSQTEGNKGYIKSAPSQASASIKEEPIVDIEKEEVSEEEEIEIIEPPKVSTYTVKKGDSLWKIAARPEIYGNGRKWNRIYEANKQNLKNPNRLRPGTILIIPRD